MACTTTATLVAGRSRRCACAQQQRQQETKRLFSGIWGAEEVGEQKPRGHLPEASCPHLGCCCCCCGPPQSAVFVARGQSHSQQQPTTTMPRKRRRRRKRRGGSWSRAAAAEGATRKCNNSIREVGGAAAHDCHERLQDISIDNSDVSWFSSRSSPSITQHRAINITPSSLSSLNPRKLSFKSRSLWNPLSISLLAISCLAIVCDLAEGQLTPAAALPGENNDLLTVESREAQLAILSNGPLTLHNGKLRPVALAEAEADNAVNDNAYQASQPPLVAGGPPAGPNRRRQDLPPVNRNRPRLPGAVTNDQRHTVPIRNRRRRPGNRYGGRPPATASLDFNQAPPSQDFHNDGHDFDEEFDPIVQHEVKFDGEEPSRGNRRSSITQGPPEKAEDDWSSRVGANNQLKSSRPIVLDTKYFSLDLPPEKPELPSVPTVSRDTVVIPVTGVPGLILRKVKGKMKTSTADPAATTTQKAEAAAATTHRQPKDLCEVGKDANCLAPHDNSSVVVSDLPPAFPTVEDFLKNFKQEIWVIPVLVAAAIIVLILVIFEIFLLAKAINKNPSRRHLFLGQMLLLGLLSCAGMATVYTLRPTVVSCAVIRLGTGLSYSIVYSTLLVKLVFLVSLNSGVYLPATYQSLLLCFAVLIQLVIGIQWLVSAPPDIVALQNGTFPVNSPIVQSVDNATASSLEVVPAEALACVTQFNQQLLGLLYVVFLIIVVVLLAFKSRGVRENYREALYVGLTMGFVVSIWVVWILAGLLVPVNFQDTCTACGLIACTGITFVIMFMPKGRQLSAMGREGLYAEDRTDVYTGTGDTGSTGDDTTSSGTPSPSFFPVKPVKLPHNHHHHHHGSRSIKELLKEQELERIKDRERLDTPPSAHRHMQLFGADHLRESKRRPSTRRHREADPPPVNDDKHFLDADIYSDEDGGGGGQDDGFRRDNSFRHQEIFHNKHFKNSTGVSAHHQHQAVHSRWGGGGGARQNAHQPFRPAAALFRHHRMRSESPPRSLRSNSQQPLLGGGGRHGASRRSSSSPNGPSHLYGHPLFRASHGDLVGGGHHRSHQSFANAHHARDGLHHRFSSQRDLTSRENPFAGRHRQSSVRLSRRDHRQSHGDAPRGREILATISPRRLPGGHGNNGMTCQRCEAMMGPGGMSSSSAGYSCRLDENLYTSLEGLNQILGVRSHHHSDRSRRHRSSDQERYPYRSSSNPNVMFRRANDMPPGILY